MSGKVLMSIALAFIAVMGGLMYYMQIYAYYETTDGLTTVEVAGAPVAVQNYRGIDADTSPNKLRGCFDVDPAAFTGVALAKEPKPLIAPSWFDCFDAVQISDDLEAGKATAYLAGDETPDGAVDYEIHRMIAVYPDGRAYLWRHYRES